MIRVVDIWRPSFPGDLAGQWCTEIEGRDITRLATVRMGDASVDIHSDYDVRNPVAQSPLAGQHEIPQPQGATLNDHLRAFLRVSPAQAPSPAPKKPTQTALNFQRPVW